MPLNIGIWRQATTGIQDLIVRTEYRPICYVTVRLALLFAWPVIGDITVGYSFLDSSVYGGVRYRFCDDWRSTVA